MKEFRDPRPVRILLRQELRLQRPQLHYSRPGRGLRISNEVVRYRLEGAVQAIRELVFAATHCPRAAVSGPVAGAPKTAHRIVILREPKLGAQALALRGTMTFKLSGKTRTLTTYIVYQLRGDLLSAVYGDGSRLSRSRRWSSTRPRSARRRA